jgi:hypothetical protein
VFVGEPVATVFARWHDDVVDLGLHRFAHRGDPSTRYSALIGRVSSIAAYLPGA